MKKFDALQASIKVAAVSGIFMAWSNFTIEAFKFAWHIVSTSPEKETWKGVSKVVCENCQEHYDDDEYHLIHGTHMCEACRWIRFSRKVELDAL